MSIGFVESYGQTRLRRLISNGVRDNNRVHISTNRQVGFTSIAISELLNVVLRSLNEQPVNAIYVSPNMEMARLASTVFRQFFEDSREKTDVSMTAVTANITQLSVTNGNKSVIRFVGPGFDAMRGIQNVRILVVDCSYAFPAKEYEQISTNCMSVCSGLCLFHTVPQKDPEYFSNTDFWKYGGYVFPYKSMRPDDTSLIQTPDPIPPRPPTQCFYRVEPSRA